MTRRGAAVARRAHNPQVVGSTPTGATKPTRRTRVMSVRLDRDLLDGLDTLFRRRGTNRSFAIRAALRWWLRVKQPRARKGAKNNPTKGARLTGSLWSEPLQASVGPR